MSRLSTRTPSFKNFTPSSPKASFALSQNKSANTTCERILRSELWNLGVRFRKNVVSLPGKPDIVFPKERLVVFCDGDFWHGRNWTTRRRKLAKGFNASYWLNKIQRNMSRDRKHGKQLRALGWIVLRVWETDILENPSMIASQILRALKSRLEVSLGKSL